MQQFPIKIPSNIVATIPAVPIHRLITLLQENNDIITSIQEILDTLKKINDNIIKTMKSNIPDNISKVSSGTPNCKSCNYFLPLIYGEEGCNRCLIQEGVIANETQMLKCTNYLKFIDGNKGSYDLKQVSSILDIPESDIAAICWLYNISPTKDNFWGIQKETYNKVLKFHFNGRALVAIYYLNLWGEWRIHQFINKYNERYKYINSIKDRISLCTTQLPVIDVLPKIEEGSLSEGTTTRTGRTKTNKSKNKEGTAKGDTQTPKGDNSNKRTSRSK